MNLNNWDASPRWDLNYLFSGGRCRDLEFSPLESSGSIGEIAPPRAGTSSGTTTTPTTQPPRATATGESTTTTTTTSTQVGTRTPTMQDYLASKNKPQSSLLSVVSKPSTNISSAEVRPMTAEQVKDFLRANRPVNRTIIANAMNVGTPISGGGGGGGPQEETALEGTEQPKDDAKKPLSKKGIIMIGAIALVAYYLMSK